MQAQLTRLLEDYKSALIRVQALRSSVPDARWVERPEPSRWSVAECVAHLNLTSEAFHPLIRTALAAAAELRHVSRRRFRRDLTGWMLSIALPPPVRMRMATTAPFIPQSLALPSELVAAFERHQAEFVANVRDAEGRAIDRVRIPSPFNPRIQYNAWSALVIIPRHQHRHLWQAEQVWQHLQQQGSH